MRWCELLHGFIGLPTVEFTGIILLNQEMLGVPGPFSHGMTNLWVLRSLAAKVYITSAKC